MDQPCLQIIDKEFLSTYDDEPCLICGSVNSSEAYHIRSRKSGGSDTSYNVVALCKDHFLEAEKSGISYMARKYPDMYQFLVSNKWTCNGRSWKRKS